MVFLSLVSCLSSKIEVFESEDDDDEVFDIFGSGDDMGDPDPITSEPKTISSRELMDLFGDFNVFDTSSTYALTLLIFS